jgi:gas vesicle protein
MSRNRGGVEFLAGLFIGGMLGALLGLLLAPQSGEETRAQLAERGIELRDELEKKSGEIQERIPTMIDEQRSRVEDAIEKGKEAAARKRQEILAQLEQEKKPQAE